MLETQLSFPEPLFLHPDHIVQVIPIVQEAIINARRHSNAHKIRILGQQMDNLVTLTIEDDGRGFDQEMIEQKDGHFGLKVMQARATRFGGKLQISSKPDYGTNVTLSWVIDVEANRKKHRNGLRQSVRSIVSAQERENYA